MAPVHALSNGDINRFIEVHGEKDIFLGLFNRSFTYPVKSKKIPILIQNDLNALWWSWPMKFLWFRVCSTTPNCGSRLTFLLGCCSIPFCSSSEIQKQWPQFSIYISIENNLASMYLRTPHFQWQTVPQCWWLITGTTAPIKILAWRSCLSCTAPRSLTAICHCCFASQALSLGYYSGSVERKATIRPIPKHTWKFMVIQRVLKPTNIRT